MQLNEDLIVYLNRYYQKAGGGDLREDLKTVAPNAAIALGIALVLGIKAHAAKKSKPKTKAKAKAEPAAEPAEE